MCRPEAGQHLSAEFMCVGWEVGLQYLKDANKNEFFYFNGELAVLLIPGHSNVEKLF